MFAIKYLVFFGVLIFGVPVGFVLARQYVAVEKCVLFLFVFFTCEMVDINFFSLESYRGTSRGFEFGMVDITSYILACLILHRTKHTKVTVLPPGSGLYLLYFSLSVVSIIHADVMVYSAFEVVKMLRMYLYFWIAYNYLRDGEQLDTLVLCMGGVIVYVFGSVVKQKYILGMFQNMGPFPHQNSLTLYMAFLGALSLSKVLNRQSVNVLVWFGLFGMCAFCVLATLSRAGMALFILNVSIVFGLSLFMRDTEAVKTRWRKIVILLIAPCCAAFVFYKASDTIIERFSTAPEESKLTRIYLAQAAVKMANENVFGVGLNNFGHKINDPYPYGAHIPVEISRDGYNRGLVETAYLMIAAETGWLNLGVFLTMLLYFYIKNLLNVFKVNDSRVRFISIAIVGALTQIYLQTCLEWVIKQTNNFYQLMLIFVLILVVQRVGRLGVRDKARVRGVDIPKQMQCHCVTTI